MYKAHIETKQQMEYGWDGKFRIYLVQGRI